jgi:hypothetical protein
MKTMHAIRFHAALVHIGAAVASHRSSANQNMAESGLLPAMPRFTRHYSLPISRLFAVIA